MSLSTVKNALCRLRDLGYIRWEEQRGSNGARLPNNYIIANLTGSALVIEAPTPRQPIVTYPSPALVTQGSPAKVTQAQVAVGDPPLDTPRVGYKETKEQTLPQTLETDLGTLAQTPFETPFARPRVIEETPEDIERRRALAHSPEFEAIAAEGHAADA